MITSTKIFESNSKMIVGSLTQESTINLMTVLDFSVVEERTKLFRPHQVKVTSSRSWIGIKDKKQMIITIDDDEVTLDDSDKKDIEIQKESIYVYKSKSQCNPDDDGDDGDHNKKILYIIIGCVGGGVLIVVIVILTWCIVSKKKRTDFYSNTAPSYTYNQILNH